MSTQSDVLVVLFVEKNILISKTFLVFSSLHSVFLIKQLNLSLSVQP